jgi:hypothetical protein
MQFFQALHDNIVQRFSCDAEDVLRNSLALNVLAWPSDPIELALYGDKQIASLCKGFRLDSDTTCDILTEYSVYKKTRVSGQRLAMLQRYVETYPISTAACERGFSQVTLVHTKTRNQLNSNRISSLLMISINGPSITLWNVKKYVISWLRKGHRSASDKRTGLSRVHVVASRSSKLFV